MRHQIDTDEYKNYLKREAEARARWTLFSLVVSVLFISLIIIVLSRVFKTY